MNWWFKGLEYKGANVACKSIVIDGVEFVPKSEPLGEIRIVILQRGWVMVGYYGRVGEECWLSKASVIRAWGTTKGLGELAANGPLKDTKLDPTHGPVQFHKLTEIATIGVDDSKWKSHLS